MRICLSLFVFMSIMPFFLFGMEDRRDQQPGYIQAVRSRLLAIDPHGIHMQALKQNIQSLWPLALFWNLMALYVASMVILIVECPRIGIPASLISLLLMAKIMHNL